MVPVRGIEPRVDPYHGSVLPLYYTGICRYFDRKYVILSREDLKKFTKCGLFCYNDPYFFVIIRNCIGGTKRDLL